jgi:hypothetical protein
MQPSGPFYNLAEAARYCGYKPSTWAKVIRDFDVPRHGPKHNRFAQSVLDAFMVSPDTFRRENVFTRRRKPRTLTV